MVSHTPITFFDTGTPAERLQKLFDSCGCSPIEYEFHVDIPLDIAIERTAESIKNSTEKIKIVSFIIKHKKKGLKKITHCFVNRFALTEEEVHLLHNVEPRSMKETSVAGVYSAKNFTAIMRRRKSAA